VDLEGDDIIITANHEEKREHESVTRHFTRRIRVPEHIQVGSINFKNSNNKNCNSDKNIKIDILSVKNF
jgi:HSP20 family molecular chaperone IbpA